VELHVYGVVPPLPVNVAEPPASAVVVVGLMARGTVLTTITVDSEVAFDESVTIIVSVPEAAGAAYSPVEVMLVGFGPLAPPGATENEYPPAPPFATNWQVPVDTATFIVSGSNCNADGPEGGLSRIPLKEKLLQPERMTATMDSQMATLRSPRRKTFPSDRPRIYFIYNLTTSEIAGANPMMGSGESK
jgi:hypothetical protein